MLDRIVGGSLPLGNARFRGRRAVSDRRLRDGVVEVKVSPKHKGVPRRRCAVRLPWQDLVADRSERAFGAARSPIDMSKGSTEGPVVTLSDDIVTLRPWSSADAWFMAEASADPAIRRYNGVLDRLGHPAPPLSTTAAEAVIDSFTSSWRAFATTGTPSGVALVLVDAGSGERVGCCGVDDWSKSDVAQIGYWIGPKARGHGYATRAATLLTRWLFELGAARVFLTIVAGNGASIAVARRAGFVYEGTMRSHGVWQGRRCDVMWFAALPHEWTRQARNDSP